MPVLPRRQPFQTNCHQYTTRLSEFPSQSLNSQEPEAVFTTCSLDDPERVLPRDHTHASNKLSWVKVSDQLPEHQESWQKG
jgi:hypothetical protein